MKLFKFFSIALLVVFMTTGAVLAAEDSMLIHPGESVGSMKLDMPSRTLKTWFGEPESIKKVDPNSDLDFWVYYNRLRMSFGVSKKTGRVVEIILYSGDFQIVGNAIRVGSTKQRVIQEYGSGESKQQGEITFLFYHQAGLSFALMDDKVIAIAVRGMNSSNLEMYVIYRK